ncbi:MAG: hypothetical protein H6563_05170 [Lewinellaceae bacterium]|nr:hypothetical protein [Lewinellaceae bacterium]
MPTIHQLNLPKHLFWEYDLEHFDVQKNSRVVIERVVERGTIKDWNEIVRFYSRSKILEVVESSKQLSKRDKAFTVIFLRSSFIHAA